MTTVAQLVAALYEQGIRLWAEDGQLRFRAPRGALSAAQRAELVARKAELLAFLRQAQPAATVPAVVAVAESQFPLSYGQQALWFVYQNAPDSVAYNMALPLRIRNELDVPALRRAFQTLVDRHAALRTTLSSREGIPVQDIHEHLPCAFEEVSAANRTWEERIQQAAQAYQRPFDLERGPVFRVTLLTATPQDHILMFAMHHLSGDGASLSVLMEELQVLYAAERQGQPAALPPIAVTYADYVRWEAELMASEAGERLANYWHQQLAGDIPVLHFPTDRPRPPVQTYNGASYPFELTPEWTGQLRALAQAEQTTLFTLLLAAYQVLLHRYTGEEEIWVGSPTGSGRNQPEFEDMVGYRVNPLVFRGSFSRGATLSFRDFLRQIRQTVLGAIEYQAYPFPLLVKQLQPVRDSSYTPLFQVMFVLEGASEEPQPAKAGELSVSIVQLAQLEGQFDLNLSVTDGDNLTGFLRYNADLFEVATIARIVGHLRQLLAGIVADPDCDVHALPLLTEAERQQWQMMGHNPLAPDMPLTDDLLHTLFMAQVEAHADDPAVIAPHRTLTYRELEQQATQVGHWLRRGGAVPNTLVAVVMEKGWEQIVAVMGILMSGAAYLPIDPNLPTERQHYLRDQGGVHLALTQEHLEQQLIWPEDLQRLCVDTARLSFSGNLEPLQSPTDLAYVIYTSGSTGLPKGVVIDHRGAVNTILDINRRFAVTAQDRVLALSALNFDLSVYDIFGLLAVGGAIVMPSPDGGRDPGHWGELMERHGVTLWDTVPALMHMLVDYQDGRCLNAPLRLVMMSGDWIPLSLPERIRALWPEARLISLGGATEGSIWSIFYPIEPIDPAWRSVPYGRALTNQRVYVLDAQLEPCPVWVQGQLYIGGAGVALGYWRDEEKTQASFLTHPRTGERLYKTGDLGRYLPDGNIEFLGREDFQVKIRGHRIELGEIEANLVQHPNIKDAVVNATGDPRGDKHLVAYVIPVQSDTSSQLIADLPAYLRDKLPEYMVPGAFVPLDDLPLTANGKVNRSALPAPELADLPQGVDYEPPSTPAEERLAAIWCDILGLERVGIHDNFFEIGGDSILSIQIVARARQAGLEISPTQVLQHGTVAALAAVAGEAVRVDAQQGVVLGDVLLTPIQHWFFERDLDDAHQFNQVVLVNVGSKVQPERLVQALKHLLQHHDALRLRFDRDADGIWRQRYAPPADDVPFTVIDVSDRSSDAQIIAIEAAAADLQASLNLADGPLMRAALFHLGPDWPGRLLWIIHHLGVDGVSWRILLDDLAAAYHQLEHGDAVQLPAKTTSYQAWATWLSTYAQSEPLRDEGDWWQSHLRDDMTPLPVDFPAGRDRNTVASAADVSCSLTVEETQALLREVPAAYHTQVNDLLLTAVVQAFAEWTGSDLLLLDIESHGREALSDDIDLSRTVGWFTAIYPVRLHLEPGGPGEAIKSIKEQLRQIPNRGIGYGILRYLKPEPELGALPQAEIAFNYFGQLAQEIGAQDSQTSSETLILGSAHESSGPVYSAAQTRRHVLEINGVVVDNQLQVDWTYSQNLHRPDTIAHLAEGFTAALRALIAHCQSPNAGGYTPSDFPDALLTQAQLDHVLGAIASSNRDTDQRPVTRVEAMYALSPSQQGMLVETLSAPGSGIHIEQLVLRLQGDLQPVAFERAWQRVVERHAILRTGFVWEGLQEPLQFVLPSIDVSFEHHDWRGWPSAQQDAELEAYLRNDRLRGFGLAQAPLMRLALFRFGDDTHQCVWSRHHILVDGWCTPLIMQEIQEIYETDSAGRDPRLQPSRPYRDYIAWLQRQDRVQAETFWCERLQGFTQPTPLRMIAEPTPQETPYGEYTATLSAAATERLSTWARDHRVLLNTCVQGAWALLLHGYSGEPDVLFGATVSGRPPDLDGIESMVGLFINTLPVRVQVSPSAATLTWLQEIQAQNFEQQAYEYCSAGQVHRWSEVPAGLPLYESLLIFQNYPLDEAPESSPQPALEIGYAGSAGAQTHYALTLMALPGPELDLNVVYDRSYFEADQISRMLAHMVMLLEQLPQHPTLSALLKHLPAHQLPTVYGVQEYQQSSRAAALAPPRDLVELQLTQLWSELLGCPVGIHDNFFELGGHSLLVLSLRDAIQRQFGVSLPLFDLFQHPTIAHLATLIHPQHDASLWSSLVAIQPHGDKPPFFCVPGVSGSVVYLSALARHLGADQPFYGLQPVGLDGEAEPHRSIEAMAAHYIEALQSVQPQGPYVLGGHSFGAFVAFEMSQQLVRGGHEVSRLVIFDTPFHKQVASESDLELSSVLLELAQLYEWYFDKRVELSYDKLQSLQPDEQFTYLAACLQEANLFPPGSGVKLLRGAVEVIQTSGRIVYTPQDVIAVPVTLFRAGDEHVLWADIPDATLGWGDVMGESLECHVLPGDHNTMMMEPQVQALAVHLSTRLGQANGSYY